MSESARAFRTADGARIAYRLWRPGAPRRTLVLIHGLASNLTRWWAFMAQTRLRERWDVLRLDLRGHGGSLWRGRVGIEVWCDDLAAILRAEGAPPAVIAGHCLGANVALWFAQRSAHASAGLVLIEPMFREALAGTLARVAQLRPLIAPAVLALRAANALGLYRRRLETLDLEALDREAHSGGTFPEAKYASPWEDLKSLPSSIYLQDLLAVTGPLPGLAEIGVPSLVMLSRGAALSNPRVAARLVRPLPDLDLVQLEARHWIPTEQPEAMRRAIDDWCEANEARLDAARGRSEALAAPGS